MRPFDEKRPEEEALDDVSEGHLAWVAAYIQQTLLLVREIFVRSSLSSAHISPLPSESGHRIDTLRILQSMEEKRKLKAQRDALAEGIKDVDIAQEEDSVYKSDGGLLFLLLGSLSEERKNEFRADQQALNVSEILREWAKDVATLLRLHLPPLLLHIQSCRALAALQMSLISHLSSINSDGSLDQDTECNDGLWETVCLDLFGRHYDLWKEMFADIFLNEMSRVISSHFSSLSLTSPLPLSACVDQTIHLLSFSSNEIQNVSSFRWKEKVKESGRERDGDSLLNLRRKAFGITEAVYVVIQNFEVFLSRIEEDFSIFEDKSQSGVQQKEEDNRKKILGLIRAKSSDFIFLLVKDLSQRIHHYLTIASSSSHLSSSAPSPTSALDSALYLSAIPYTLLVNSEILKKFLCFGESDFSLSPFSQNGVPHTISLSLSTSPSLSSSSPAEVYAYHCERAQSLYQMALCVSSHSQISSKCARYKQYLFSQNWSDPLRASLWERVQVQLPFFFPFIFL
jgi:hypothetical protein